MIIPCFNVEAHIEKCLSSVFQQSYPEIEVVCIDDGSTDGTVAEIESYKDKTGVDLLLIKQENTGACGSRNRGIERSTGEYLQFLDADDFLLPDKIAGQISLIEQQTQHPDLVVGDYINYYNDGSELEVRSLIGRDWLALIRTKMGTTSANLWLKEAVLRAGGWSDRLNSSQDYELIFRMLKQGCNVLYDSTLATRVFKRMKGSISQTNRAENWKRYLDLRKDIRTFLEESDYQEFDEEIETLNQYLFMAIRALSQYDMAAAVDEFDSSIPKTFRPKSSKAITSRYIALYSILGFAGAEKIIRLLKPHLYRRQ